MYFFCLRYFVGVKIMSLILFVPMQKVHEAMNKPGVSAKLKDVLKQLSNYDNVPRKKAKFQVGATGVVVTMYLGTFNKGVFFLLIELDEKQP